MADTRKRIGMIKEEEACTNVFSAISFMANPVVGGMPARDRTIINKISVFMGPKICIRFVVFVDGELKKARRIKIGAINRMYIDRYVTAEVNDREEIAVIHPMWLIDE